MSRPTPLIISSTLEAWDADVNTNKQITFDAPFPVFQYDNTLANLTTNYPPANYDRCLCAINDTTFGWIYVYSDGTTWKYMGFQKATDPTDLSGTTGGTGTVVKTVTKPTPLGSISVADPADSPATADALRDDLVTNTIPDIRTELGNLKGSIDTIEGTSIQDIRDCVEGIKAKINTILANLRSAGLM